MQAAINVASGFLPTDLPNPPNTTKSTRPTRRSSPSRSPRTVCRSTQVNDFADTLLAQKLSEVTGVGLVTIEGNQKPAVRVQVNPAAISSLGLSLEDIRTILGQANVNAPKGSFNGPRQSFTIGSNDQIFSADAYEPIIVAYKNGAPVRLGDVANIIDSVENDQLGAWVGTKQGEKPAVLLDIQRQPGANIIQTVDRVKQLLPKLTGTLPPSVHVSILADRTETIRASVSDVQFTLLLTVALVVMVMLLFLRKFWATVITSVALAVVAHRHLRHHVSRRIQPRQFVADGPDDRDRLRGRRRDCDDRKHCPLYRGGRFAAGSRAEGRAPDRIHRRVAERLAHRGLHSAFVHDRDRRTVVPRICHHHVGRGRRLGVRLSHAHADDVREIAPRQDERRSRAEKPFPTRVRKIISSASAIYTNAACAG